MPAVPEGWTVSDPVPLWIRVDAPGKTPDAPSIKKKIADLVAASEAGPIEVGVAQFLKPVDEVDMDGTNAFQIGAYRALQEHSLISPVGAPLCTWPPSPGNLSG